jgi:hypothetical protein
MIKPATKKVVTNKYSQPHCSTALQSDGGGQDGREAFENHRQGNAAISGFKTSV